MIKQISSGQDITERRSLIKRMMKTFGFFCIALVFLLSLASCAKDRSMDVVAEVNDRQIYRWELDRRYDGSVEEYQYSAGGLDLSDPKNANKRKEFRETLLQILIDDVYITESAKRDGYDLNDEEKVAFEKEFDETIEKNLQVFMKDYEGDSDAREKAEKDYENKLAENHLTMDFFKESQYDSKVRSKLSDVLFAGLVPDDEELKKTYDQMIQSQEDVYNEDPAKFSEQYFSAAQNPNDYTVIFNPPGFKRVKQIMIYFPEEIDKKLKEITAEQAELLFEQKTIRDSKGSNDPQVADIENKLTSLREEEAGLYVEAHQAIEEKVNKVEQELAAGKDFDEVLKEFGEDEDMISGPISETGYLIGPGSGLLPELVTGAAELEKVGDVSERIRTVNGYHFIKIEEVVKEGAVGFDKAKQLISELMTLTPRATTLEEYLVEKKSEHNADNSGFKVKINKQNIG